MPWKPITEQAVMARLDGQVREVLATAWNSSTGAVKVAWPPQNQAISAPNRFSRVGKTEVPEARYEPLDADAFKLATKG